MFADEIFMNHHKFYLGKSNNTSENRAFLGHFGMTLYKAPFSSTHP